MPARSKSISQNNLNVNTKRRGSLNNFFESGNNVASSKPLAVEPKMAKEDPSSLALQQRSISSQNYTVETAGSVLNTESDVPKPAKTLSEATTQVNDYYKKFKKDLEDILEDVNRKKAQIHAKTDKVEAQKEVKRNERSD